MVLISPEFVREKLKQLGYPLKITFKRNGEGTKGGEEAGSMKALWNGDW